MQCCSLLDEMRERSRQIRPFSLFPITRTMEYHLGGQSWDNTQFSCFLPWTTQPASQGRVHPHVSLTKQNWFSKLGSWPSEFSSTSMNAIWDILSMLQPNTTRANLNKPTRGLVLWTITRERNEWGERWMDTIICLFVNSLVRNFIVPSQSLVTSFSHPATGMKGR